MSLKKSKKAQSGYVKDKDSKLKTCGNCIEDKEPMFRLVRYHEKRSYSIYFCSYKCLIYDVLDALRDIEKDISNEVLEQLIEIVGD